VTGVARQQRLQELVGSAMAEKEIIAKVFLRQL